MTARKLAQASKPNICNLAALVTSVLFSLVAMSFSRGQGPPGSSGRKQLTVGQRPVSESDRISLADRLEEFRSSTSKEMTFESDLSNHDRAVVHDFCKKMGFKSKSYGKGAQRSVTVYKSGREQLNTKESALRISSSAQGVIGQLFALYPPTEDEIEDEQPRDRQKGLPRRHVEFRAPLGAADIAKQVSSLADRVKRLPALQQIVQQRAKLPIAAFESTITSAVDNNQVVLIAGETGCGKTTQVPQFILQHLWSQGKPCKIICTQPRRISAISVAERIAAERGEVVGTTIGYQIRLEMKGGRNTSVMFQTNGVLLRKMVKSGIHSTGGENLGDEQKDDTYGVDATHIIVDEIHERDRNADFLLIVLRDILLVRPDLRVVLMSATLDSEKFSRYFNNCPIITVPGFTYPVNTYFLEDVLSLLEAQKAKTGSEKTQIEDMVVFSKEDADAMDNALAVAWLDDDFEELVNLVTDNPRLCNYQHSHTGATALMIAAGKGQVDDVATMLSLGADISKVSEDGSTALEWAKMHGEQEAAELLTTYISTSKPSTLTAHSLQQKSELLEGYQSVTDQEEIDFVLIEDLLHHLCSTSKINSSSGAILVFLPGWEDISRMRQQLATSPFFSNQSEFHVLPLHSMVPSSEQKKVFKRPPPGVQKIVLATNIAETAITIDDVVYVIDTGRAKEKSYDPYTSVSTLQTAWISRASMRQRAGRAGRCQAGDCYHLFSRLRADSLPEFQQPEIKRAPLEELCLQVKLMEPEGRIADFISKAIDPPLALSVQNAVLLLQDIGALTGDEKLTELGKQLGSLPVHPATSKMLLFAILLNCLGPALTIACASGYREPFVLPMAPREKQLAAAAKRELASSFGGYSDHLAIIAAFDKWEAAKSAGQEQQFCAKFFVSGGTMAMLSGMRQQLQSELAQKGFLPHGHHPCNLNAQDAGIVRAVIAAGTYPMIGTLLAPHSGNQKIVVQTSRGQKVRIHPHSANFELNRKNPKEFQGALVAFDEITRGEKQVYIRNCTLVKPHPLLLISTELVVAPLSSQRQVDSRPESLVFDEVDGYDDSPYDEDEEKVKARPDIELERQQKQLMYSPENLVSVVVDRWLKFEATAEEAAQLFYLRQRLAAAIKHKIEQPRAAIPEKLAAAVYAVACLMSFDGLLDLAPQSQDRPLAVQPQPRLLTTEQKFANGGMRSRSHRGAGISGSGRGSQSAYKNGSPGSSQYGRQYDPADNGRPGKQEGRGVIMRSDGRGGMRQEGRGGLRQDGRGVQGNFNGGTTIGRNSKRFRWGGAG